MNATGLGLWPCRGDLDDGVDSHVDGQVSGADLRVVEDGVPEAGDALDAFVHTAVFHLQTHARSLLGEQGRHLGPPAYVVQVRVERLQLADVQVVLGVGPFGHQRLEVFDLGFELFQSLGHLVPP